MFQTNVPPSTTNDHELLSFQLSMLHLVCRFYAHRKDTSAAKRVAAWIIDEERRKKADLLIQNWANLYNKIEKYNDSIDCDLEKTIVFSFPITNEKKGGWCCIFEENLIRSFN